MLVIAFSIAVEESRAEEMRNVLMDDYGIAITNEVIYNEKLCWSESVSRVYFDCFAPSSRIELLKDYLDNIYTGTAIMSY